MEISDRRYPELAAILDRLSRVDRVRVPGRRARTQSRGMSTRTAAKNVARRDPDLVPRPASGARDLKEILLVDSSAASLRAVQNTLRLVADVNACSDFKSARSRLQVKPPDLLITNLRLQAYNGLHLVHLAAGLPTRCIAYAEEDDLLLVREVQAAGAFYERSKRLLHALCTRYASASRSTNAHRTRSPRDRPRRPALHR